MKKLTSTFLSIIMIISVLLPVSLIPVSAANRVHLFPVKNGTIAYGEYSGGWKPPVRATGNRQSGR